MGTEKSDISQQTPSFAQLSTEDSPRSSSSLQVLSWSSISAAFDDKTAGALQEVTTKVIHKINPLLALAPQPWLEVQRRRSMPGVGFFQRASVVVFTVEAVLALLGVAVFLVFVGQELYSSAGNHVLSSGTGIVGGGKRKPRPVHEQAEK